MIDVNEGKKKIKTAAKDEKEEPVDWVPDVVIKRGQNDIDSWFWWDGPD